MTCIQNYVAAPRARMQVIMLKFADVAQLRAEDVSFNERDVSGTDDLRTDGAIGKGKAG